MAEVLDPKQLGKEAQAAYQRGDYGAAAKSFQAAAQSLAAAGDKTSEAEMLNHASVAFLQAGDAQSAFRAVDGTPATFAAAGDVRRQGLALGNLGAALDALNRKPEAVEAYQQSAELLEQAGESEMRAHVLQSLSKLQLRSGRQIEALATMEAGISGFERPTLKQRFLKKLLRLPFKFLRS